MAEFTVRDDVKELVSKIIAENNFDPASKVEYQPGSAVGDGYSCETISVKIQDGEKSLNLFVKCSVDAVIASGFKDIYAIESFFYETLHPAYLDFQKKRNVKDVFDSVPKLYGAYKKESREILALENLTPKGYELYDRLKLYDDEHLTFILKSFARFHAVSFAFKDQERETYDSWRGNLLDYAKAMGSVMFDQMGGAMMQAMFAKFDPVEEAEMIGWITGNVSKIMGAFQNLSADYAIVTKGDCWNNNMLFRYEDENKKKPIDMMFVDWQMMKEASPIFDIFIIVYPMISQEMLDNLDHYLKIYHDELTSKIRELGSDPEKLYPYTAFLKEWDESSTLFFFLTVGMLRLILTVKEEAMQVDTILEKDAAKMAEVFKMNKNEDILIERTKMLARHFMKKEQASSAKTQ